jgi:hypothetical protein
MGTEILSNFVVRIASNLDSKCEKALLESTCPNKFRTTCLLNGRQTRLIEALSHLQSELLANGEYRKVNKKKQKELFHK